MALLVYHRLVDPPEVKTISGLTNAEFIPEFFRRYTKVSYNAFANLIGVSPAYVSKVMNKNEVKVKFRLIFNLSDINLFTGVNLLSKFSELKNHL